MNLTSPSDNTVVNLIKVGIYPMPHQLMGSANSSHLHNDSTLMELNEGMQRDPLSLVISITIAYGAIFVAGLLGNAITCTVISRNKSMHTATNYYLFNLAISDLLLLVCGMPPDIYKIWYPTHYPFSAWFCVLQGLLSETSTNATVLTITAFTVERYIAICHPFRQHTMSKLSRAVKFILVIWILAFCLAIPQSIQFGVIEFADGGNSCTIKNLLIEHAFEVSSFVFFVGPMTVICILYVLIGVKLHKSKLLQRMNRKGCDANRNGISAQTRVIRMLIAVVVAFFLCWAPFHAQRLMAVYGSSSSSDLFYNIYTALTYISGVMYFLSTCVNPLLYNIMSHKFRDAFKSTLARHCGFGRKGKKHSYSVITRNGGAGNHIAQKSPQHDGSIALSGSALNRADVIKTYPNENNLSLIEPYNCFPSTDSHSLPNDRENNKEFGPENFAEFEDEANNNNKKIIKMPSYSHSSNNTIKTMSTSLDTISQMLSKTDTKPKKITITEKFRKGTRNLLNSFGKQDKFGLTRTIAEESKGRSPFKIGCQRKFTSIDSPNTISNSSLQEVDDEEFNSSDLIKYMEEINIGLRS